MTDLDQATVRELVRQLEARLEAVDLNGGRCPSCRDAEAHALLARLRALAGDVRPMAARAVSGVRRVR
jgi:hypothetical protein